MHAIPDQFVAWPWDSLNVPKDCTKVNVKLLWEFGVENISVKLQHDVCKF